MGKFRLDSDIKTIERSDPSGYYGKLYRIETFLPEALPDTEVIIQDQRYWWDANGS